MLAGSSVLELGFIDQNRKAEPWGQMWIIVFFGCVGRGSAGRGRKRHVVLKLNRQEHKEEPYRCMQVNLVGLAACVRAGRVLCFGVGLH